MNQVGQFIRGQGRQMRRSLRQTTAGFSIIEILVVMVVTSIMVAGIVSFFGKQSKILVGQKMVADVQSLGTIGFFLIGRDIRRAGGNAEGYSGLTPGTAIPFGDCQQDRIQIYTDLNGDGDITDTGEDITYNYEDTDGDGVKDTIKRYDNNNPSGTIFIQNVTSFDLVYFMTSGTATYTPSPYSDIKRVQITIGITGDRNDPGTGKAISRTFSIPAYLFNYGTSL